MAATYGGAALDPLGVSTYLVIDYKHCYKDSGLPWPICRMGNRKHRRTYSLQISILPEAMGWRERHIKPVFRRHITLWDCSSQDLPTW